ncbi:MAG: 4Fe-4S binding protein [Spirochaetes bacterium]|nr:4Fe-4S binding protein [Spirochaetota bacterium]
MKRKIIEIDENKCTGCGLCVPDCPEGALQIIEGKARLVSDLFCDGLGACIGTCPEGAITVTEREAEPYSEALVMSNIVKQGQPVIQAHLEHLADHGEAGLYNEAIDYLEKNNIEIPEHIKDKPLEEIKSCSSGIMNCPGSAERIIESAGNAEKTGTIASELRQWPVQLKLINPAAPYFDNADLLIAADCVPFAYGDFHRDFLKGKIAIMFCPKLDPFIEEYVDKLVSIISAHYIRSITVLHMEVPCCGGVNYILDKAFEKAGKNIPVKDHTITMNGQVA